MGRSAGQGTHRGVGLRFRGQALGAVLHRCCKFGCVCVGVEPPPAPSNADLVMSACPCVFTLNPKAVARSALFPAA